MPDELATAQIQQAVFEYRANFKEPLTGLLYGEQQLEIVTAMQKALSPWQVGFENITWNQAAKNVAEVQCTFGVRSLVAAVQVDVNGTTLSAFNLDWSRAPKLLELFQTSADALKRSTARHFQSQRTTLSFHLMPGPKHFKESLGELVNERAIAVENAEMYGISAYSTDYTFVIDASVVFQGAAFIKMIRNFVPEEGFEKIAETVRKDEEKVLRHLGRKLE
jgi:hypothetical protein